MELKNEAMLNEIFERIRIKLNKQSKAIALLYKLIILLAIMNLISLGIIIFMAVHKPDIKAEIENYFEDTTELAQLEENFELIYED